MVRALQGLKGLIEGGDGRGVEGVAPVRAVDGDEDHAVGGGVDPDQIVIGIGRRIGQQRMGDRVDTGSLGRGDVEGVQFGVGRLAHGGSS